MRDDRRYRIGRSSRVRIRPWRVLGVMGRGVLPIPSSRKNEPESQQAAPYRRARIGCAFISCAHFIVGMTHSAPSLMPEGQREVTVLVLVYKRTASGPC